jgi:hypothetical protein
VYETWRSVNILGLFFLFFSSFFSFFFFFFLFFLLFFPRSMKARQCNQIKTCGFLGECKEPAVKGVSSGMCPPCFKKKKAAQKRKEKSRKNATGLYTRHPIPQDYLHRLIFSSQNVGERWSAESLVRAVSVFFFVLLLFFSCSLYCLSICNPQLIPSHAAFYSSMYNKTLCIQR